MCHIIPPHMLDEMAKSPNKKVSDAALANIAAAARMRAMRELSADMRPRAISSLKGIRSTKKQRIIHDAKRRPNLNGRVVRVEGNRNTGDKEIDEACKYTGDVHNFYRKVFNRNSIDGVGLALKSSVRFRENMQTPYNNAFWVDNQMAYGDGDGIVFRRFTSSLDIIAHELTHGVIEYSANLKYEKEPGALNESFSDVFGSLVKQWRNNETARQADWLIGDDVIFQTPTRTAIRSLKAPGTAYQNDVHLGTDPQPAHMNNKYNGSLDYYGVHINSGIPNHAFYLLSTDLGGYAWEKAGRIWYDALHRLRRLSDFEDCAKVTYLSAGLLYGQASREQQAVKKAWRAVGINI